MTSVQSLVKSYWLSHAAVLLTVTINFINMIHDISSSSGRLTHSHVHALNKGAVITQSLIFSQHDYQSIKYKPGDLIQLETEDENIHQFRCRILDIEAVKNSAEAKVILRFTLEKE